LWIKLLALETAVKRIARARDKLRTLPLPHFLSAIETSRNLSLTFLALCGPALAIYMAIDLQRGVGPPEPLNAFAIHMLLGALAGVAEEVVFRGLARRFLGNGGLVIGTICWIILHQFYAQVATIWRLPADILVGIFYLKLWRGRLWWLALVIHPLWNVAIIGGWQIAKMHLA
jgi:membrane protease YdiL (CAAX protease family)